MVISLIMNASKLKTKKQKQISSEQSLVANYSRTKRKNRINGCGVIFEGKTMHGRQRTTEHSVHVLGFTLLFTLQYCKGCNAEFRDMGEGKRTAAVSRKALESIKLFKWTFPMKFKIFPSVSLHLTSSGELRRTPANDLFRPQQPGTKTYFPELGFVTAVFPR